MKTDKEQGNCHSVTGAVGQGLDLFSNLQLAVQQLPALQQPSSCASLEINSTDTVQWTLFTGSGLYISIYICQIYRMFSNLQLAVQLPALQQFSSCASLEINSTGHCTQGQKCIFLYIRFVFQFATRCATSSFTTVIKLRIIGNQQHWTMRLPEVYISIYQTVFPCLKLEFWELVTMIQVGE